MGDVINVGKVVYAIYHTQRNEHRGALVSEIEDTILEPGMKSLFTRRLVAGLVEALVSESILQVETETVVNNDRTTRLHFYRLRPEVYQRMNAAQPQEAECTQ